MADIFSLRSGKAQPAVASINAPRVDLASALGGSSSVKMLAGEIAGQAMALTGKTAALKDGIQDLTRALFNVKEQVHELRHELGRRK